MYVIKILAIAGIHRGPTRSVYILHRFRSLTICYNCKGS